MRYLIAALLLAVFLTRQAPPPEYNRAGCGMWMDTVVCVASAK